MGELDPGRIRKQTLGTCGAEACANAHEYLTGEYLSEEELWKLFLEAGGKEDTSERGGAVTLVQILNVFEKKNLIGGYQEVFKNPAPHLKKNRYWNLNLTKAKSKILDAIQSPDKTVVLGIFTGRPSILLDDYMSIIPPREIVSMHAVHAFGRWPTRAIALAIENSWGKEWGFNGMCRLLMQRNFERVVREAYIINKPL